ncbi:MAG: DUF5719 family protein [Acidimicrobiales bacterium]
MNAVRLPSLVLVISLLVGGLVIDSSRETVETAADEVLSPVSRVAPTDSRSSTWFCAAGTGDEGGLADALVVLANTTPNPTEAVVSVFPGSVEPRPAEAITELVLEIGGLSTVDIRPADLAPGSAVVSLAVEIAGGGVLVDKVTVGATGVDRSPCATDGSTSWVVPSGATVPGARLQLVAFNPFPDDAVIDVDFVSERKVRTPEDLVALHVPAQSSRLIEVGDVVAASSFVSTFVEARSGRVVVEAIQSFDGSDAPIGLGIISGVPAPAESWTFTGISPARGPARLALVNPGDTLIRADVEVYPAGGERFVEPFEITLSPGQHDEVVLVDEGRLAGIESFTLVVRSFDGPRLVAGMEQRPSVELPDPLDAFLDAVEAPSTGFAASPGQAVASNQVFTTVDLAEDDTRSALHVHNPAVDSFVTIEAQIALDGASRDLRFEIGPQRTLRIPLGELATGVYSVRLTASAPVVAAREITGLSSRSWSPLLPG